MYASAGNMKALGGYVETAAEQLVRKSSAFETVASATSEVQRVEARLYSLVARLIGDMPDAAFGGAAPTPSGLLHELDDMGRGIKSSVFRMDEMLAAIEGALP